MFWFFAAFVLCALLMPLARKAARKIGLVDEPGGRKKHENMVPLVGGLVVFPVFIILSILQGVAWSVYAPFFVALLLLILIGAWDDARGLSAWLKFGVQFIAAILIVIPGKAAIVVMGDLFGLGPFGLNFMALPFSVIATVLLINAINLIDGLDGLSGGIGFTILFWLAVACGLSGDTYMLGPLMILMGALAGFLLFNMRNPWRRKACVFIGDSGSMALGLCVAWFCIHLAKGFEGEKVVSPISVAWMLALPIYDTCGQFARRVSQGRHPFDADHDHFHHHFIYAGFPVGKATAFIVGISFLTGMIGVGGIWLGLPEAALTYPWIALLFVHIYMSMRPHRFRRLVSRLRGANSDD